MKTKPAAAATEPVLVDRNRNGQVDLGDLVKLQSDGVSYQLEVWEYLTAYRGSAPASPRERLNALLATRGVPMRVPRPVVYWVNFQDLIHFGWIQR